MDFRAFRDALGCFATGVAVVTAPATDEPIAMTVSSFNAVSLDPPLILFSVRRDSVSLPILLAAPHFAVNVLRSDQADVSSRFARGCSDKWAGLDVAHGVSGCPNIGQCLARFDCHHFAQYDGGDHVIIVGSVEHFSIASEGEPLLFFRGAYRELTPMAA